MKLNYLFLAALLATACSFSKDNLQHESLRLPQERQSLLDNDMYQNSSLKRRMEAEKKSQKVNLRFEYPSSYTRLPENQKASNLKTNGRKEKAAPKRPEALNTESQVTTKESSLTLRQDIALSSTGKERTLSSQPDTPVTSDELASQTEIEVIVTDKTASGKTSQTSGKETEDVSLNVSEETAPQKNPLQTTGQALKEEGSTSSALNAQKAGCWCQLMKECFPCLQNQETK